MIVKLNVGSWYFYILYIHLITLDSNFEWIGEADDGCLICRWDEEALINEKQGGISEGEDEDIEDNSRLSSLAYVTQIAVASSDFQNTQVGFLKSFFFLYLPYLNIVFIYLYIYLSFRFLLIFSLEFDVFINIKYVLQ